MNTVCSSLGYVSCSSCNRFALSGICSVTIVSRISRRGRCLEIGQLLSCKKAALTLHGEIHGPGKDSPSKSHSRQRRIEFLRRRKSNSFKLQSAEGTERSLTEDHNSGPDKIEKTTKRLNSNEGIGESQGRIGETLDQVDNRLLSDSWFPGKLVGDRNTVGGKATPADFVSSKAKFSRDSESEERDPNENSPTNYSPYGEHLSVFNERSLESEHTGVAARIYEVTDDYSSEPLLEKKEEIEYVTRIMVPRQRYIRIPKAELLDALSLFPIQHEAKLSSMCAYLELVLHAKNKFMLEELRADYSSTDSSGGGSSDALKASSTTAAKAAEITTSSRRSSGELSSLSTGEETQGPCGDRPQDADLPNNPTKTDNALVQEKLPQWKAWGRVFLNLVLQRRGTEVDSDVRGDSQTETSIHEEARTASAKRFQKNFLKLLKSAQFEGLSADDLELTAALNSDYLLTLPVAVDWKRASESNAVIFRRGYAKEQQKGLLLGAKFDYLQAAFLRETLKGLTGPLISTGRWFMQRWKSLRNDPEGRVLAETVERWVEEPVLPDGEKSSVDSSDEPAEDENGLTMESEMDLPIWKAAQQALPRYEAVLSSAGSRGLLLRRILISMGFLRSDSIASTLSVNEGASAVELHLRPNFLSRVSMKDIWLPASKAVIGESAWKRFGAVFSVFFTRVTLQEPAFQELVLLYSDDAQERSEASSLQLQMYKTIPLPDLKIVFPSKKLSFRLIDIVRLDFTTFVGLTAFLYNYHFEGFLSSPSAFTLDVIAASALLVFLIRAALSYKQTWDRYQLLVNKTLYEKTLANGFGVVHFLLDAAEEQQFKEAIVAFSVLSKHGKDEGMSKEQLANACERFLFYRCKEQTEMPLENAINTLLELGLVYVSKNVSSPSKCNPEVQYKALTYDEGVEALKQYWESIPSNFSSLITR